MLDAANSTRGSVFGRIKEDLMYNSMQGFRNRSKNGPTAVSLDFSQLS